MLKKRKKLSGFLSLLIVATGLTIFPLENANAAAGTLTNGSCSSYVGDTTNASIAVSGNDCVVTFTGGSTTWTAPTGVTAVRVLVVGGGAGGDRGWGAVYWGHGGGGGQVHDVYMPVTAATAYTVTVGSGGSAGVYNSSNGGTGGNSVFSNLTAYGGNAANWNAAPGGNSGWNLFAGGGTSGTNTSMGTYGAGGGGGAGGSGNGVAGGPGVNSDIVTLGTNIMYGSGGSGNNDPHNGSAYSGGGTITTLATANRGGGGSDWSNNSTWGTSAAGAAGVVIIRYQNYTTCSATPTVSGNTTTIQFTNVGSCTWSAPSNVNSVRALIVGGGGGGGAWVGGGGGGGGVIEQANIAVTSGSSNVITVGNGGYGSYQTSGGNNLSATNGGSSSALGITAYGGGYGASWTNFNTGSAATGGGAAHANTSYGGYQTAVLASISPWQGFAGGTGSGDGNYGYATGGGGGAGYNGGNASAGVSGNGGPGRLSTITGSNSYYGGGGGGGCHGNGTYACTVGTGGMGGGGGGNQYLGVGYQTLVGTSGTTNTGGGGGGSGGPSTNSIYYNSRGGNGGSGIVIIQYTTHAASAPIFDATNPVVAGGNSLALTWSAPLDFGNSAITAYQVDYSTSGTSGSWTTASSGIAANATSYTITGLSAANSYYVRVAAINSSGTGTFGYPWKLVYSSTTPYRTSSSSTGAITFATNNSATYTSTGFSRVRYKVAATYDGVAKYSDVDFYRALGTLGPTSTTYDTIYKLQAPAPSGANGQFVIQANVNDMNVFSNSGDVQSGSGISGRVEIWPWDYTTTAATGLAERSAGTYDDSDSSAGSGVYGSFQVHNLSASTKHTVLAWNRQYDSANYTIGFGNNPNAVYNTALHSDWTFCSDAGNGPFFCPNRSSFSFNSYINAPTTPLSTDATLSALTISSGTLTPTFSSGTTSYNDTVTSTTTSVTVTPTATQANATIQVRVNGGSYATVTSASASSAQSLNSGSNTIDIKVTAQDGSTIKTYTITVLRVSAPTVTTSSASSITSTGATLNGTVTANGASTTISTCLSSSSTTTAGALSGCSNFTPSITTTSGTDTITATATGLKPGITYYYQVIGTNSVGTTYGSVVSLLTSSTASTTVTNSASSVGSTTATLNGSVTPNGAATTNSFCWGSTSATNANGSLTTCTSQAGTPSPTTTTATISYTANITGLTAGNTYYFQSVGTNSLGTTYGNVLSFRALGITTSTLIDGAMNDPYSIQLTAVGGNSTYGTWTLATGSLPAGMAINSSTGYISGTPTSTGTFTFSVTTVSGGLTSSSVSLSLRINANSPSAPSNVTTLLNNDTTVTVGWTLSSSNGGSAITYHRVDYSTDGVNWTQISATISSTATSYTVASVLLTPGTPYYFRVFALNAIGTSQPVASTRPITVPKASTRSYNSLIKISNVSPTVYANSSTNIGGGSSGITLDTSNLSGTVIVYVHLNNPFTSQTLTIPQTMWTRMASIVDSWNNGVAPGSSANTTTEVSFQNIIFTATVANAQNILQSLNLVTTSVSSGGANGGASLWFGVSGYDSAYKYNYANRHFYYDNRNSAVTYTNARAYAQTYSTASNGTSNSTSNGYLGQGGYLATLSSSSELTFGLTASGADNVWLAMTDENQEGVWEWDRKGGSPEAGSVFSYTSACGSNSAVKTDNASYRSTGQSNATFTSTCALTSSYTPTNSSVTTAYSNGFKNNSGGYKNWNTAEPNNSGGAGIAENYGMMTGTSGVWNDLNSTSTGLYLVEFGNSSDFVGVIPGEGMAVLPIAVSTGTNATQGLYSQDYWMGTAVASPGITTSYAPCGNSFIQKNFYWTNNSGSDPNTSSNCSATSGWIQHSYGYITIPGTYDGSTTCMIQFTSTTDDGFALKIFGAPNNSMANTASSASQYLLKVWQDTGSSNTSTLPLYRGQSYPIDIWFYNNSLASQLYLKMWTQDSGFINLDESNSGVFFSPEPRNLNIAAPVSNRISTTKGSSVNIPLTTSNITGSASYSVSSGTLPSGLSINSTGTITGTPSVAGTVSVKIKVTDSNSNSAESDYISINITEVFATFTNKWVEPVGNHGIGGMVASPGLGTNTSASSVTLSITSLSSTTGIAGATITITGTGFSNGIAGISFNNGLDIVSYTVVNDTTITITVPQNEQGITDQFAIDPTSGATVFSPSFTGL